MTEEENDRSVSRRQFLGVGSAAVGATIPGAWDPESGPALATGLSSRLS